MLVRTFLLIFFAFSPILALAQSTSGPIDLWQRDWTDVTGAERAALLSRLDFEALGVDESLVGIQSLELPWRENMILYRMAGGWEPRNLLFYYIQEPDGGLVSLDGTSNPIHEINRRHPPEFTIENAPVYIWFFGFFVRGQEGPFLVAEDASDTFVPKSGFDGATLVDGFETVEQVFRPLSCLSAGEAVGYLCTGSVYYSNAVFEAVFQLSPDGNMDMIDDRPRATNLPVKIAAPVAIGEVENFEPKVSDRAPVSPYAYLLEALEDPGSMEWTTTHNYVVGGLSAALLQKCRTDMPVRARGHLGENAQFALAAAFDNIEGDPIIPNVSGEVRESSILGYGRGLVAGIDCETEATELADNIARDRIRHTLGSVLVRGCRESNSIVSCGCLAKATGVVDSGILDEPFSIARLEALYEANPTWGFNVVYVCGGFTE